MTNCAARKQLLLAESEINRELLGRDVEALVAGARQSAQRALQIGGAAASMAGLVAAGAAGFSILRGRGSQPAAKSSWASWMGKAIRLGLSVWTVFGAKKRESVSLQE
jgi:hypothetical protein